MFLYILLPFIYLFYSSFIYFLLNVFIWLSWQYMFFLSVDNSTIHIYFDNYKVGWSNAGGEIGRQHLTKCTFWKSTIVTITMTSESKFAYRIREIVYDSIIWIYLNQMRHLELLEIISLYLAVPFFLLPSKKSKWFFQYNFSNL